MKSLTNEEFLEILSESCSHGRLNDEKFEKLLSTYWPYNLVFKGNLRKNDG